MTLPEEPLRKFTVQEMMLAKKRGKFTMEMRIFVAWQLEKSVTSLEHLFAAAHKMPAVANAAIFRDIFHAYHMEMGLESTVRRMRSIYDSADQATRNAMDPEIRAAFR